MASSPEFDDLHFHGRDGAECEEFVKAVRRIARKNGKQRDFVWIAEAVDGCFSGDALRWHVQLDDETKGDWKLLERALFDKFPAPESRDSQHNGDTIPVPAAAAAPPQSTIPRSREGRLKLLDKDRSFVGYVSKFISRNMAIPITAASSDALVVACSTGKDRQHFSITDKSVGWNTLGVCWTSDPSDGALPGSLEGRNESTGSIPNYGLKATEVWVVSTTDEITAQWTKTGAGVLSIHPVCYKNKEYVWMAKGNSVPNGYKQLRMMFEECN